MILLGGLRCPHGKQSRFARAQMGRASGASISDYLGAVLPKVGRVFGRGDCKFMLEFLLQTVATRFDTF
jgi:hypothetical protein